MNIEKINIFTDGSCINNGKKNSIGGIGIYFENIDIDDYNLLINETDVKITNQTLELLACIQALKIISDKIKNKELIANIIYIYTDSTYVINCINKWYKKWIDSNWLNSKGKEVENKELIEILYKLSNKNNLITIFKHVKAHTKKPKDENSLEYKLWYGNYMADKLAKESYINYNN